MCKTIYLPVLIVIIILISVAGLAYKNQISKEKNTVSNQSLSFGDFRIAKEKLASSNQNVPGEIKIFTWDETNQNYSLVGPDQEKQILLSQKNSESTTVHSDGNDYQLQNGQLVVKQNNQTLWRSSDSWWVDGFVLADANNDGKIDLNLSVWKAGDYGSSKPFWIPENDWSIKNHFFIFDNFNNKFQPVWQSSNLAQPNCEFTFSDLNNDGRNELITIEGNYSSFPSCQGQFVSVWHWNGWGFTNDWRSAQGAYKDLRIEKIDTKSYIEVN